jgi:hypothetical protein
VSNSTCRGALIYENVNLGDESERRGQTGIEHFGALDPLNKN